MATRKLEVVLVGDDRSLGRSLDRSQRSLTKFGKLADHTGKRVSGSFKRAAGAAAGIAAAYASISGAKEAVSVTEELAKTTLGLNKGLGLSVKTASEFGAVLKARGAETKQVNQVFATLAKQVESAASGSDSAAASFKTLGVTQKELGRLKPDKLIGQIADGMKRLGPGTERTAVGARLFGRGWQTLVPLLRGGNKELREQLGLADKYGATFDKKGVKSVEKMIAAQREAKLATMGLQIAFGRHLAPVLTDVIKGISKFVAGMQSGKGAGGKFRHTLEDIGSVISDVVGWIKRAITNIDRWGDSTRRFIFRVRDWFAEVFRKIRKVVGDAFAFILRRFADMFEAAGHLPFVGGKFDKLADKANRMADQVDRAGEKTDDLRTALSKLPTTKTILVKLAAGDYQALEPVNVPRRRRRRAGGPVDGLAAVSPGEMFVTPGGKAGIVPGPRTAADSVLGRFPRDTAILTGHGQSMVARGASVNEALSRQLPHFQKGGRVPAGRYSSTAYGPPWGGIQGTGVTRTGVNLKGSPHILGVAVDPNVIPLGSKLRVSPNPFHTRRPFLAFDTGGAIDGRELDFYDWRGRSKQNAWGVRAVNVSPLTGGGRTGAGELSLTLPPKGGNITKRGARRALVADAVFSAFEAARSGEGLGEVFRALGEVGNVRTEGELPRRITRRIRGFGGSGRLRNVANSAKGRATQAMVRLGNAVAAKGMPYQYGGGHNPSFSGSPSFDCSGFVSAILHAGGLLGSPLDTSGLRSALKAGHGRHVTVGVRGTTGRSGHTMMRVFDNYYESGGGHGPARTSGWNGSFDWYHPPGFRKGGRIGRTVRQLRGAAGGRPAATLTRRLQHQAATGSFGQLLGASRRVQRQIGRLAVGRETGRELTQIRRLRQARDILRVGAAGRIGESLGRIDTAQGVWERTRARFPDELAVMGVDETGETGLGLQIGMLENQIGQTENLRSQMQRALKRAEKLGDRKTAKQIRGELAAMDDQLLGLRAEHARATTGLADVRAQAAEAAKQEERDRLAEAVEEANRLQEEANARLEEHNRLLAEDTAAKNRLAHLTTVQGPQMIAGVVALVSGGIGGAVGAGFSSPSYPGGVASY